MRTGIFILLTPADHVRAFHRFNDLAQSDPAAGTGQRITAVRPFIGLHDPVGNQLAQNLQRKPRGTQVPSEMLRASAF